MEELLLGNINPEINNLIPNNARILNVELNGKNVILNFNEETVMNIDTVKSNNPSLYYKLVLQSIIDSIKFQFKDVDKIYFYFNGKLYNYLDTYGPLENGIKIDYNLLKK